MQSWHALVWLSYIWRLTSYRSFQSKSWKWDTGSDKEETELALLPKVTSSGIRLFTALPNRGRGQINLKVPFYFFVLGFYDCIFFSFHFASGEMCALKLGDSRPVSTARKPHTRLGVFIQHRVHSKSRFWIKQSKHLLFGGKLAAGLAHFTLATTQHPLFLALCIHKLMWESAEKDKTCSDQFRTHL